MEVSRGPWRRWTALSRSLVGRRTEKWETTRKGHGARRSGFVSACLFFKAWILVNALILVKLN